MKKNSGSKRPRFLSAEMTDEAIAEVMQAARAEHVAIVLIGGAALQFYGSTRLTTDIDFATDGLIDALPHGPALSFGGEQTKASNGVIVDLIIRDDRWSALYEATIENAKRFSGTPAPIARPEYLLAMKIAAGRPKDMMDASFLLSSVDLNAKKTMAIADEFLGTFGAQEVEGMLRDHSLLTTTKRRR